MIVESRMVPAIATHDKGARALPNQSSEIKWGPGQALLLRANARASTGFALVSRTLFNI